MHEQIKLFFKVRSFSTARFPFSTGRTLLVTLALLFSLAACSVDNADDPVVNMPSDQPQPSPDANPEPSPEPSPDPEPETPTPDAGTFSLEVDATLAITEGETQALSISVSRAENHRRPISLSIEATDDASAKDLNLSRQQITLSAAELSTSVDITLDIAVAPILPQQRSLTVTADDGVSNERIPVQLDVTPVQAPDIYLLVGQSNMEGYSKRDAKDASPGGPDESHPRIKQLNVTGNDRQNFDSLSDFTDPDKNVAYPRFVEAQDPLHESFDPSSSGKKGSRIGLGLSFAKAALANTTQDIILVPAAWAGTGFCDNSLGELAWNPTPRPENSSLGGTSLYDRAITRINIALQESGGILRGILWHQGEADATSIQCASVYDGNLKNLISSFRQDILPDARGAAARGSQSSVPFVLGTMSRGDDDRGEYSEFDEPKTEVDRVHRDIELDMNHTALSNHDDLVPPAYDCGEGFCVHFGADAYREMGNRYYQRLLSAISAQ